MAKCALAKEILITTEDKAGMLAEVTGVLSEAGVNIQGICAYSMEGKAIFMIIADDNQKAKDAVGAKGWETKESDVVVAEVEDKVGAAREIAEKLKEKDVNLHYCYATACSCDEGSCAPNCSVRLVLRADDANQILSALS